MAGRGSLADEEGTLGAAVIEEPEPTRFTDEDSDLIEVVDIEGQLAQEQVSTGDWESEPAAAAEPATGAHEAELDEPPSLESPPAEAAAAAAEAPPQPPDVVPSPTDAASSADAMALPDEADELVDVTGSFVGPSMSELEQIDFFIEQELYEDAVRVLAELEEQHADNPEVVNRRLKLKDIGVLLEQVEAASEGAEELFADEEQYIDLAKELEAELAAEEAMVDEATGRGKGEAILEDVFREFQKGVAEQLSEEDSDTHFNLGIAYREMGLLPEAIREFQVASRDTKLFVESCSIIGLCYQEQGMWSEAASWYQKALVAPDISEDARLGLRYDLAVAYEAAGDDEQALGIFAEILAADPAYRDVSNRLSNLSEQRQAN
jgi:tetratricopeptide (TPR) repeat protein